ncbi:MAG TPA: NADH-quinone oxidoreductase subunit C [Gaiellaceae bacterium]|jgi:NADH-quinone oxidoreductase subunit C|nr:NADH-quinone oxidoreductase subunit C [Gaiellaceae bacterium]
MTYAEVPGFASVGASRGETTVVVETARLLDAARYLRDEQGFNFLSDIAATDYLGWNERPVAGYWGHAEGRDINLPGSWGLARKPEPRAKRFSVSYQLLAVVSGSREAPRVCLQVWCDDGEPVPSVVSVWPTADWHEREAFDLMGIVFEGHPNLKRILMDDDWEGHPLRKDYPMGGEPVRFSGEE